MAVDPYLIPGTQTLKNKLGITDAAKLDNFERKYSSARDAHASISPIPGKLDFDHLKDIHKNMFKDVYEWAGQIREVGIEKGKSVFARPEHIESFAKSTFNDLKKEDHLRGLPKDKFTDRAAHYLGEINAMHPFREGNGRTQRSFISELAQQAGYSMDWSKVSQEAMKQASIYSMGVDASKLKALLDKAIIEPLKKKQREDKLESLSKSDPTTHKAIVGVRDQMLELSSSNISSQESRTNLANAVTDRLLDHHEKGQSVTKLVAPIQPKIVPGRGPGR